MLKKFLLILTIFVLAFAVLTACGGAKDEGNKDTTGTTGGTTTAPSNVDAEAVVNANCVSCHGANLEGAFGPALNKIGATLTKDQILDVLKNGKNAMPANVISGDDAEAVAEWLSQKK